MRSVRLSLQPGRIAVRRLTRHRIVLSTRRGLRWQSARLLTIMALFAACTGAAYLQGVQTGEATRAPADAQRENAALRQELRQQVEQFELRLQLSDSRSHELERQIDSLNGQLRERQEALTFFKQSNENRHQER
ncbi:hypothetical protein BH09PSE6_BH09PSE6_25900 [soil metagenome]